MASAANRTDRSAPPAGENGRTRVGARTERLGDAEDALLARLVGDGARKGSTFVGRVGDVARRPPMWAVVAAALCATGADGRRAALRGGVCHLSAAAAHLPIKAIVGRRRPPGAGRHQVGPFGTSFPSGHTASDLAFVFGAAQEQPLAFVPLSAWSLASHWSLVRARAHYPSDVLAGGALGIAVALIVGKLWPSRPTTPEATPLTAPGGGGAAAGTGSDGPSPLGAGAPPGGGVAAAAP